MNPVFLQADLFLLADHPGAGTLDPPASPPSPHPHPPGVIRRTATQTTAVDSHVGEADACDGVVAAVRLQAATPRFNQFGYRYKQQPNKMLAGDNLALFLNNDPDVVDKYRRQYRAAKSNTTQSLLVTEVGAEEVSLRGLGNAVLDSKIYRVKSAARCKALRRRMQANPALSSPTAIDCESDDTNQADSTTVSLCLSPLFPAFDM